MTTATLTEHPCYDEGSIRHSWAGDRCEVCHKERDPSEGGRPPGATSDVDSDGLTFRERDVLDRAGQKQVRIAEELGISRQQVNQIVKRLKEKKLWPEK